MKTASLINNLYLASTTAIEPAVGMACTAIYYTDRRSGTITEVKYYATRHYDRAITIALDNGDVQTWMRTKAGKYVEFHAGRRLDGGRSLIVGIADNYIDPTF